MFKELIRVLIGMRARLEYVEEGKTILGCVNSILDCTVLLELYYLNPLLKLFESFNIYITIIGNMGETFPCRWALLGLSGMAETFRADVLLPREDEDPISRELVTVFTTEFWDRVVPWLEDHHVPTTSRVEIFASFEKMLVKGPFDIVHVSTLNPLRYLLIRSPRRRWLSQNSRQELTLGAKISLRVLGWLDDVKKLLSILCWRLLQLCVLSTRTECR